MANAEVVDFETRRFMWGTDISERRLLHLALRVEDLDRSLRFYVDVLGMKLKEIIDIHPAGALVAFVSYGDDYRDGGFIELASYPAESGPYTHGTGFHHISIGVADVREVISQLEEMGVEVTVQPTEYLGKGPFMAYVKDPDGYSVEFIQTVAN
jgi:lactoylglutathione lyase